MDGGPAGPASRKLLDWIGHYKVHLNKSQHASSFGSLEFFYDMQVQVIPQFTQSSDRLIVYF